MSKLKFIWVKGHNGHEFNERCDEMAVASSNSDNLLEDGEIISEFVNPYFYLRKNTELCTIKKNPIM